MTQAKDRLRLLMEDVTDDPAVAATVQIGSVESCAIDKMLESQYALREDSEECRSTTVPRPVDQVASVLYETSPFLILIPYMRGSRPGLRLESFSVPLEQLRWTMTFKTLYHQVLMGQRGLYQGLHFAEI